MTTKVFRQRGIDRSRFTGRAIFIQGVKDCMDKARALYPNTPAFNEVPLVFFKTGTTAGYLKIRGAKDSPEYNLEFNSHAIKMDWDDMFNDTIPHEVAHLVDRAVNGGKGPVHGSAWKRIAKRLGCNGERCHTLDMSAVARKRRVRRHAIYNSYNSGEVRLSMKHHNAIMRHSYPVTVRKTGERLHEHQFSHLDEF